jgi:hypothetical protein
MVSAKIGKQMLRCWFGINGAMASTTDKDKSIDPVNKS